MGSRSLLRAFGMSVGVEDGVTRLERGLSELKQDVDAALAAFRAKIERAPAELQVSSAAGRPPLLVPSVGMARSQSVEPATRAASLAAPYFDPTSTYVCLAPSGSASTIDLTPEFWTTIDQRNDLAEGRLVAAFACDADWSHWERHPHGEEVLFLLSGEMTIVLEEGAEERGVELKVGGACIVPRATWHRAKVIVPSKLLAITYGRGTEHRPR